MLTDLNLQTISTPRLKTRIISKGGPGGIPVIFLHGNLSAATWWEETLAALPPGYWGLAPDQRGFGAADPAKKIDATRGLGDLSDDLAALMDQLGLQGAHLVGHSMGGGWSGGP
jgi:pimeloyl-ACP methyl ester carboxylesterase